MFRRKLFTIPLYAASAVGVGAVSAGVYYHQSALKKVEEFPGVPSWSSLRSLKGPLNSKTAEEQIYLDSFSIQVPQSQLSIPRSAADRDALLNSYARAFYTSPVFKLERLLLGWFKSSTQTPPETDKDILAKKFQVGDVVAVETYTVVKRDSNQVEFKFSLQKDVIDGTSWLAVQEPETEDGAYTFWFGTAIYPAAEELAEFESRFKSDNFEARFHKLYSRVLIDMAVKKLASITSGATPTTGVEDPDATTTSLSVAKFDGFIHQAIEHSDTYWNKFNIQANVMRDATLRDLQEVAPQLSDEEWSTFRVLLDTFTPGLTLNQCKTVVKSHPQLPKDKAQCFLRAPLLNHRITDDWSYHAIYKTLLRATRGGLCINLTYSQPAFGKEFIYWSASGYPGPDPLRDTKRLSLSLNEYQFLEVPAQGATLEYDVVVVGTGAGGGVVAGRLASAGLKVLVLEKGQFYSMDQLPLTEAESYHYLFEGNGSVVSEDGGLTLLAGSTFGGGTQVNWSASLAPPHYVREEWSREYGLSFFESAQFQRNIEAVSKRLGVSEAHIQHNLANEALLIGAKRLGYPTGNIPQNTANRHHDCGWCTFGCSNGGKQSTTVTWLQDAQQHGAHFAVNCQVKQVIIKDGRAEGVIAHVNGSPLVVKAKRVVVSAGALNSPLILERSGLRNKNIGRHLRVHPVYIASGYFPDITIDQFSGSIMTAITGVADRRKGTGYGTKIEILAGHPVLGCFLRSWRNQITVAILIRDKDNVARVFADKEAQKPCVEFSLGKFDAESGVEGVQAATKILVALGAQEVEVPFPGMKPFVAEYTEVPSGDDSVFPNVELKDSAKLAQFLDKMSRTNFKQLSPMSATAHIMGSCRMGTSPKVSVVNPKGETWETKGLYVADASVFPTSSGVNPMITIQSVAYSIAEFIKEDLFQSHESKL
ncbi:hypothetical protein K493DRAFT_407314 [Basidiobolus meristosporus CBS 931.73]|uniref:Long-chain-alcohol oxidase n=1 Tax=Basidiobolus meristosporus CBS 931.73 TaxID=1314790 RepID=A0A1Y1YE37_9FUNG|nr:hypothetical protein K493DRAFT_407314 [Basidiobolus meristosporus CBS 931.73]|eukprot:ORX96183.1 hypothetical protein K493DRAFT_407314 [Basidiobolus meristosporus CBS 931.73]